MDVETSGGRSDEDPAQQVYPRLQSGRQRVGGRVGGQLRQMIDSCVSATVSSAD